MQETKENKIIGIGSIVTIFDLDLEEKLVYKIVSTKTGEQGELSFDCVLGKALLGKTRDETVLVKAESPYEVEILAVDNSNVKIYRNTFFCFQGLQFYHELAGGYIFALPNKGVPSWDRLSEVKEGDIIFHSEQQKIKAVSVVERGAYLGKRPREHYLANDEKDAAGLFVDTNYFALKKPISFSQFKNEIVRLQGDTVGKGYPFNKNGGGNQGYLFNLNKPLAKFFMEEILKYNPFMASKDYVEDLLQ